MEIVSSLSGVNGNALAEQVDLLDVIGEILIGARVVLNLCQGFVSLIGARFEDTQLQIQVGGHNRVGETVREGIIRSDEIRERTVSQAISGIRQIGRASCRERM